jgi:RNA polymerase sigma factor (sigma-70 family)
VRDDPVVRELVARAAGGDQEAWNQIVERYAPLVWAICGRYRLTSQDVEDVGQTVWLRLVEQIGNLREPAALPGWLATTTQHECLRVVRAGRKRDGYGLSADELEAPDQAAFIEQELLAAERNAAVRAAFAGLPGRCRQLLSMLISDPPLSYLEISTVLGMPVGSIGPQRLRCLRRLRQSNCLADFLDDGPEATTSGGKSHE